MTAQILQSELLTLLSDSKRKNVDIRTAAEQSLAELKALPNTSDAQLAADLRRRPNFVRPFLLSCAAKNPKLALTSISSLGRLAVSTALAKETLKDVLDVLRDCASLSQDVQLRILQMLPTLLQNYSALLTGDLLATALHTCFLLFASKQAVVSNTAAATLQQLIVSAFGKVVKEDAETNAGDIAAEIPLETGSVAVRGAALDAYRLLNDICLLTEGHPPTFLNSAAMPQNFGLEILESVLSNYAESIPLHAELVHVLRVRLLPFIIRVLSEKVPFSTSVRTMRLLPIIFSNMMAAMPSECEMVLSLLNHMLDPEAAMLWKRVLCMEIFRGLHTDPALVREMFAAFDASEGKRNIVQDNMGILVRLASEKPAIIGLSSQSTVPAASGQAEDEMEDLAALQAEGVAGTVGVAMTLRASTAPGISTRLSTMRVPCLDQLDKTEPPTIPPAYLYTLALTCLNAFSDGLARFLQPFAVASQGKLQRKSRQLNEMQQDATKPNADDQSDSDTEREPRRLSRLPINPLQLESHAAYDQIRISATMVETCWPALLATYSTFFHAALDSEFYHALVRSFQKFTQISGLLRLSTPRDAFLTALGKNAVPSSISAIQTAGFASPLQDPKESRKASRVAGEKDSSGPLSAILERARPSLESNRASLNTRNLLCLRALLHLGIALGPILDSSWSIIFETLQQADQIIHHITSLRRLTRGGVAAPNDQSEVDLLGDIGNEIGAVRLAASKLLESSADLPDESYLQLISSICALRQNVDEGQIRDGDSASGLKGPTHGASRPSIASITIPGGSHDPRVNEFVIDNLGKLIECNVERFQERSPEQNGWHRIVDALLSIILASGLPPDLRLKASRTLCEAIGMKSRFSSAVMSPEMRLEGLLALKRIVDGAARQSLEETTARGVEADIHLSALETLRAVLENHGDRIDSGWNCVFTIIGSVFVDEDAQASIKSQLKEPADGSRLMMPSSRLVRSAFGSLQLICSDFLNEVPRECFDTLLKAAHSFCGQTADFNIALTTTAVFTNLSNQLWESQATPAEFDKHSQQSNSPRDWDPASSTDTQEETRSPILSAKSRDSHFENVSVASQSPGRKVSQETQTMLMNLCLRLADIALDSRLEVRHNAIHALFDIMEAWADRWDASQSSSFQSRLVFRLLHDNEKAWHDAGNQSMQASLLKPDVWNETAVLLLEKCGLVYRGTSGIISSNAEVESFWTALHAQYRSLLNRGSLDVENAVFINLQNALIAAQDANSRLSKPAVDTTWCLWRDGLPSSEGHASSLQSNRDALCAYLACLQPLQALLGGAIDIEQLGAILHQLAQCVMMERMDGLRDISKLSPVQNEAMQCLQGLQTPEPAMLAKKVAFTARLITLAYRPRAEWSRPDPPTFQALTKAAMALLRQEIMQHTETREIYTTSCFRDCMSALVLSLDLRVASDSSFASLRQEAVETIVQVLKACMPQIELLQSEDAAEEAAWEQMVLCLSAVLALGPNDLTSGTRARQYPESYITSVQCLCDLFVPCLGDAKISRETRRPYIAALFRNSLIHEPHPDDMPADESDVLEGLHSQHIGRVNNVAPRPDSRASYLLLDRLFRLVARGVGTPERRRLARAAAPYLMLRIGLVLKAYILDQPLRGRMPVPASQRKELLYIVQKLVDLDADPDAFPATPGVRSKHRNHLYQIYPLVVQALRVARRDAGLQAGFSQILEALGHDFEMAQSDL